jgi:cell filamentation protein
MSDKQVAIDELSFWRVRQLRANPIKGNFDAAHLIEVHRYIFQDAPKIDPQFVPGELRPVADDWAKTLALSSKDGSEPRVYYSAASDIYKDLDKILKDFGGPDSLKGLPTEQFAERMAKLYGDLDYLHSLREGNSRTLREFTRQLAFEAGFDLQWVGSTAPEVRDTVYVARAREVIARRFPEIKDGKEGHTKQARALQWFYRRHEAGKSLKDFILEATTLLPDPQLRAAETSLGNAFSITKGPAQATLSDIQTEIAKLQESASEADPQKAKEQNRSSDSSQDPF